MHRHPAMAYYADPEDSPPLTQLIPASVLTTPARRLAESENIYGRALIGMEISLPGVRYRGLCKPNSDIEITSLKNELDADLFDVSMDQITNCPRDSVSLLGDMSNQVLELGFMGLLVFDKMRDLPPFGLELLNRMGVVLYSAIFKMPNMDWIPAFKTSKPYPFDTWQMRANISQYAIENPEKFYFRKLMD